MFLLPAQPSAPLSHACTHRANSRDLDAIHKMLSALRHRGPCARALTQTRLFTSSPRITSPANSQTVVEQPPTVANSSLLRTERADALWTPGLRWQDEEQVGVGFPKARVQDREIKETDLQDVEDGGRATEKLK